MIDAAHHGTELRAIAARLRRVPEHCLRDPIALIDWHSEISAAVKAQAEAIHPTPVTARAAKPLPAYSPSSVTDRSGREVRVERRRARV